MSNFEIALIGVTVMAFVVGAYAIAVSRWHERKRHAHR